MASLPDPTSLALPEVLRGHPVDQVAFLVPDLAQAIEAWKQLGYDEWKIYTYSPDSVPELTYRGQPGTYSMRLALSGSSPQIELIQPMDGPSIYHEWVESRGYGLHHVGFFVDSAAEIVDAFAELGTDPAQTGRGYGADGDGAFAYFDAVDSTFAVVLEAIEVPAQRRPSETI